MRQGAVALQIGGAVLALGAVVLAALRFEARLALAVALIATPMFSPYYYDYDIALYAPAFALLLPEMDRRGQGWAAAVMVPLAWIAGGTGMVQNTRGAAIGLVPSESFAGFAALALMVLVMAVLVMIKTSARN